MPAEVAFDKLSDSKRRVVRYRHAPDRAANPGEAALMAVLHPRTSKELYFVADGTGGHAFAETMDGHLKNVAKWRKLQKQNKQAN